MKILLPLNIIGLLIFSFIISSTISSCGSKKQTADMPDLSQADNMKIMYKMDFDSTNKMKIKTVSFTDAKQISGFKQLLSSDPFAYLYCSSSGAMNFYKDSTLIYSFAFNTTPDLRHIAYNYNNKLVAVALSEENAKFLDSFK